MKRPALIVDPPHLRRPRSSKKWTLRRGSETRIIECKNFISGFAQFVAIITRFVAALTGDRDRWLLVYADERRVSLT